MASTFFYQLQILVIDWNSANQSSEKRKKIVSQKKNLWKKLRESSRIAEVKKDAELKPFLTE